MSEKNITTYHWKKVSLLKSPKKWAEYDISIINDGIEITAADVSEVIAFKDIRTLQLYKPNPLSYALRIVPLNKKNTFEFSDIFATGYNSYTAHTGEFEKIVIAINQQCVSHNSKVRYILGDKVYIALLSFYRVFIPIAAVLLLLLGVGLLVKKGQAAILSVGISLTALYFLERKNKVLKQKPYDPNMLIKSGLKAVPL